MGYVIRNCGTSRQIPFKSGFITMERDQAIETDDLEIVKAFTGQPQINITQQPGTLTPVEAPTPPPGPEPPVDDDQGEDDNNQGNNNDDQDDNDDEDDEKTEAKTPDYESMLKRDLLVLAQERNLEVPDQITKAELIELLRV